MRLAPPKRIIPVVAEGVADTPTLKGIALISNSRDKVTAKTFLTASQPFF
jgi:hypothetical protein